MDENLYIWQTPEGHKYLILYFIIINLIGVRCYGY